MLCPKCNADNRSEAKFCDQCGFPLTTTDGLKDNEEQHLGAEEIDENGHEEALDGETESYEEDAFVGELDGDLLADYVDDDSIVTDYELYQPLDSDDTDSFDPAAAIDRLVFDGEDVPVPDVKGVRDLSGFDARVEEFEERLIDPEVDLDNVSFRDGGTIQLPRVEGEEPQKSTEYLASSTTKKSNRRKLIYLIVALAVVAAGAIAFGTYQAGMWGGKPVPNVVGMTEADARQTLESVGFTVRDQQVKSDDTAGLVLLMDPSAGQRIDEGSEVVVHVATPRTIPDVVGKTQAEAEAALSQEGYSNVSAKKESSEEKKGTVISIAPKAGTEAKSSTDVTITIAQPYIVPNVANKSYDDAVKALKDAGFGYDVVYIDTTSYPEGTIIGTEPAAGTEAKKGDYIMIQIAQDHGSMLEDAAREYLAPGTNIDRNGTSYTIESLDSVAYISNNTVSYTATAREYVFIFGSTVTNPSTETISGTIVFDDNNQVVTVS